MVPGYDFYYSISQIGYLQSQSEEFQNEIEVIDTDDDSNEDDVGYESTVTLGDMD